MHKGCHGFDSKFQKTQLQKNLGPNFCDFNLKSHIKACFAIRKESVIF